MRKPLINKFLANLVWRLWPDILLVVGVSRRKANGGRVGSPERCQVELEVRLELGTFTLSGFLQSFALCGQTITSRMMVPARTAATKPEVASVRMLPIKIRPLQMRLPVEFALHGPPRMRLHF